MAVDAGQLSGTRSSERQILQPAQLVSQVTVTQSVTSTSVKPLSISSTASAAFQYPDLDPEQKTDLTSPVYPEEEGEVYDWEADMARTLTGRYLKSKTTGKPLEE